MMTQFHRLICACWLAGCLCSASAVWAQTTAFTYQGKLTDAGNPATGNYDLQFKLFDTMALGTGTQQGATSLAPNVTVTAGIFTVQLDFGASVFNGAARFLEISVKPVSSVTFTVLGPRQPMVATPYAIRSLSAASAENAATALNADGLSAVCVGCVSGAKLADNSVTDVKIVAVAGSKVTGTIPVAGLPAGSGNYIQNDTTLQASSNFSISGNGTLGGVLTANVLSSNALRQELTNYTPNLINGFLGTGSGGAVPGNRVTAGVVGATIGGGGFNGTLPLPSAGTLIGDNSHRVTDWFGTVSGGFKNQAGNNEGTLDDALYATVGGGYGNTASGAAAVVGGGSNNFVNGANATVAGGSFNHANNDHATVAGGLGNIASGRWSTVAGGNQNTASGDSTFAAGSFAKALHQGAFVWGDSLAGDFASTAANQFLIRANGGVGIGTNAPAAGYQLDVKGQVLFRPGGSGGGVIGFATPNAETGLTITGNGTSRADLRFDGTTLKLVAASTGIPPATNGVSISTSGNVGIGVAPGSFSKLTVQSEGTNHAIEGSSDNGFGVNGFSLRNNGVNGLSFDGNGVYGTSGASNNLNVAGVSGASSGTAGIGVSGYGGPGNGIGVYGYAESAISVGVFGRSFRGSAGIFEGPVTIRSYSTTSTTNPGNLAVSGNVTKGGGAFKIDHPLDPENKYLYHSFVESPEMMNIYNGNVTTDAQGEATVTMPEWFEALNRDFRYQLTVIGQFAQAIIAEKMHGNQFKLKTSLPNVEVSWQVTGVRQDAFANLHRIPVEELKPVEERGTYLHADAFHQPVEKSLDWARRPEQMRQLKERREHPQSERIPQPAVPATRSKQW